MKLLIGIDDTDNLDSRGTGHLARQLVDGLAAAGLAEGGGVTRHQLLVDPRIPYTSHNSAACIEVEADADRWGAIDAFCRDFLVRESAPGADAGLCLAARPDVAAPIQEFGARAKTDVLTEAEAHHLAESAKLPLYGLTGTGGGVIGALAAVGLRAAGNDGRFLWLPGLRELVGTYTVDELERVAHIPAVQTMAGTPVSGASRINVGDWPRPLLRAGQAVLVVEETNDGDSNWQAAPKDLIKRYSE